MNTTAKSISKFSCNRTDTEKFRQITHINSSQELIGVAVCHLAEKRGFMPGYALQDWFEGERLIQEQFPLVQ